MMSTEPNSWTGRDDVSFNGLNVALHYDWRHRRSARRLEEKYETLG